MERVKEVIKLYLEVEFDILQKEKFQFVGIHHIEVSYDEANRGLSDSAETLGLAV